MTSLEQFFAWREWGLVKLITLFLSSATITQCSTGARWRLGSSWNRYVDWTDGEIIAAALGGQREAFGEIARRYGPGLLSTAVTRLGRREWAEEAVQETLLAALKSLATYNSL